jgi:hypothetical protein
VRHGPHAVGLSEEVRRGVGGVADEADRAHLQQWALNVER